MVYKSKKATRDGRSYFFRLKYKDILGVQHDYSSPKYKTKKETMLAEAQYKLNLSNKKSTGGVTIDQVFMLYKDKMKNELKPQSIPKMVTCYNWLPIKDVKVDDLNYYHIKMIYEKLDQANLSADYKNKILGLFKRLIKFSAKCYATSDKVLSLINTYRKDNFTKKEMDFFTYEEYIKFSSVITNQEHKVFFDVLYYLGLRKSEALALTWGDIDFEKETVSVTKNITRFINGKKWQFSTPKTKNSIRVLPTPKRVLNGLKMIKKGHNKNDLVFGGDAPYGNTTICNLKNKYCKLADIRQIRIHDFRHSTASLLLHENASIQLISKYLGHANINITLATYAHLYKSELEDIKETLDSL